MPEDLSQPAVQPSSTLPIKEEIISVGTASSDRPKKLKLVFALLGIFFILASTLAAAYLVKERQQIVKEAQQIEPCADGPGGCCDPSNPRAPGCGCRDWEECTVDNGACSTNKSCCVKNSHGCSQNSDCCSGQCCSGTCRAQCGQGPQLTCGADGNGVWVSNTGDEPIYNISLSWFARYCDWNAGCVCGLDPGPPETIERLDPGQTVTRSFTNSHPSCQWAWQTDITATAGTQTCHRSDNDCGNEPCVTPSPTTVTPTPTLTPTPSVPPPPPLACLSLAGSPAPNTREPGERVTFTCNARSGTPVDHFEFRASIDSGNPSSIGSAQAVTVGGEVYKGDVTYTIPRYGCYKVECRACTSRDSSRCTTWGQAQ